MDRGGGMRGRGLNFPFHFLLRLPLRMDGAHRGFAASLSSKVPMVGSGTHARNRAANGSGVGSDARFRVTQSLGTPPSTPAVQLRMTSSHSSAPGPYLKLPPSPHWSHIGRRQSDEWMTASRVVHESRQLLSPRNRGPVLGRRALQRATLRTHQRPPDAR